MRVPQADPIRRPAAVADAGWMSSVYSCCPSLLALAGPLLIDARSSTTVSTPGASDEVARRGTC
jgi:hypothetical protein